MTIKERKVEEPRMLIKEKKIEKAKMLTKVRRMERTRTRKERKFGKPRFGKTDRGKEFAGPTPGIGKSYKPAIKSRNKNLTGQGCTGKPVTSYHDKD